MYENIDIRKENATRILKKKTALKKKFAIVATIIFVATSPILISNLKNSDSFKKIPVDATRQEEVIEQVNTIYGIGLDEIDQQMDNGKETITNFCLASNSYKTNPSSENRQNYVTATKSLATSALDMVKENIKQVTGEEEINFSFTDNSVDGQTNEIFANGINGTYKVPSSYSSLLHNAKSILSYQGDGSNDNTWKDEIGEYSNIANNLLSETTEMLSQEMRIQNGKIVTQSATTNNSLGK